MAPTADTANDLRVSLEQVWFGSRAGGFEAEAEAMKVIESRDRSRSQ